MFTGDYLTVEALTLKPSPPKGKGLRIKNISCSSSPILGKGAGGGRSNLPKGDASVY
jgi:hypothetical protein